MLAPIRDHYAVLGVAPDAAVETIHAAHRDRARVATRTWAGTRRR